MPEQRKPSVVVIGAGMTGILAVIKLRQAGITDVVVLEKRDKIGGTWRENTYPGVACDVPSHMYTYSFEPNPDWSSFFAGGEEIQKYFEHVTEKYDVLPSIRFNQTVAKAIYKHAKWHIETDKGDTFEADFLIAATGVLHHPVTPDIPGLESFSGKMFHTARWDHSVEFDDTQKVGVIGTGSTAAQAIPELIDSGADTTVFQRTPQWILPLSNFDYPDWSKKLARKYKWYQTALRKIFFFILEQLFTKAVIGRPFQKWLLSFLCKTNLRWSIKDNELREKLRPDYLVGCKRVIVNNTFYKAIQKNNAHLVTKGIKEIVPEGVVTQDGILHKLDTLVLSTGFDPTAYVRPMYMTGRDGLDLNEAWDQKIEVYRSLLLPGFPNFFLTLGPYVPAGNFSVIAMSEVQLDYIIKLLERWQNREFDEIEPKPDATQQFEQYVKNGMKNTTWVGGCQSWYLDDEGNPMLWPYTWKRWVSEMEEPQLNDLIFRSL